jgi:hypothetical protein
MFLNRSKRMVVIARKGCFFSLAAGPVWASGGAKLTLADRL